MIEADLYGHLSNDTTLTSLVADRIYPMKAPNGVETPYITYMNVSNIDITSIQGANYANKTRFQIDIFSKSYLETKEILGAVKSSMYQYKTQVHNFSSWDLYESDTELHRQLIEFNINN